MVYVLIVELLFLLIRLSTKLLRLKQGPEAVARDGELEDTIQELEARVATLESQKGMLQSKLNLAKQNILDLGVRAHYRPRTGEESQLRTIVSCMFWDMISQISGHVLFIWLLPVVISCCKRDVCLC